MTPNEQLATDLTPEGEDRIALTNLINTLDPNNTGHQLPIRKKKRLLFPILLVLAIISCCIFFFSFITTSTIVGHHFQIDLFSNQSSALPQVKHLTPEESFYVYGNQSITDPRHPSVEFSVHLNASEPSRIHREPPQQSV